MAIYFFDSSALVKRYAQETGSAWVETVASRHYIFLARITQVEVIAAFERRKRIGTLSTAQVSSAITAFRTHLSTEYAMIDVSRSLIGQAMDLAEIHGLRAYDAVQLAAALQLQNERNAAKMPGLIFVSADQTLNAAATAESLSVEDPNTH